MKLKVRLVALSIISVLFSCFGQGTITFDGTPTQPPGSDYFVQGYLEAGMSFTPVGDIVPGNGFERVGQGFPYGPDNGTAYLAAGGGESLAFRFADESPFSLISVDLAEFLPEGVTPVTIHFIGYRMDGGIVTQDFITDGLIDGTGPLADFQTFNFSSEFSDLTRVEIPTYGWSLDNLVISVPEPTTCALFISGGLVLIATCRRRKIAVKQSAGK